MKKRFILYHWLLQYYDVSCKKRKVVEVIIKKKRNNEMPSTVSVEELQELEVL